MGFRFDFPEEPEPSTVPLYNGFWFDNDERFTPRRPKSGKQNPENPIPCFDLRPLICSFHYGQLLSKGQVLCGEKRSESEFFPNESYESREHFYHEATLTGPWKFVNDFRSDEFLRGTTSIAEIMVMFNHSSQRQTLEYLCIQPEEIKDAYMKLSY